MAGKRADRSVLKVTFERNKFSKDRSTGMRIALIPTIFLACGSLASQNLATLQSGVPKLEGLNPAQQLAVEDYVRQHERPTGEIRWIANRRMQVFSSDALRALFPSLRFLAITWITEADEAALHKYSIPGPILETVVLDTNGKDRMPHHTGYGEEFGDLMRAEHIKITDATSAAVVRSALRALSAGTSADDLRTTDVRHENSNWLLGYQEFPFRAISGYEEIREVSYYLVSVDPDGFVISGRSVIKELERRKLKGADPSH